MSSVIFKLNHSKLRCLSISTKNGYSTVVTKSTSTGRALFTSRTSLSPNTRYQINSHLRATSNVGLWSRRYLSSEQKQTYFKASVDAPYSYAYGRSDQQLTYKTIGQLLNERVANESLSGKPFIISHHENIKKTFAQFNEDVNRVAKAMYEQLGLRRGDVAGLWSCNTYKWMTIQYACARLGVILCTVNPVYRVPELDYVLRKGDIKTLFLPGKNSKQEIVNNYSKILAEALSTGDETHGKNILENIVTIDGDELQNSDLPSGKNVKLHTLEKLTQNNGDIASSITDLVVPDDPLVIMFTSGTTGKPKGAYLSHFTTANNVILVSNKLGEITDDLAFCIPLPFFHSFAGVLGCIATVACPFQIIIPCLKYDVRQLTESMVQNNATHIMATPTLVIDLLNYLKKSQIKLPTLRGLLAGGASVPIEVAHQFVQQVPSCVDFRIGYGATELGPCSTACRPMDSFEKRTETVGSPLDFVEIKIINPETKSVVKLGETGEIHSRGHNVMLGYWKDPVKTKETIDHAGWYNSGDLGVMDEEGFLKIIGRTKEMIIVGGENVYPRELEELLHTHPEIFDVHVIGVPDERKGEEICAWIQLANPNAKVTEEDIKQFCKDKISYFKVPRYVMFVDSFPTTPTGKTQKFIMREITCKKLNLKEKQ